MKNTRIPLILALLSALAGCRASRPPDEATVPVVPSLAEVYQPFFSVGAAADEASYKTHRHLLLKHFNSMTTENEMKFEALQPVEGEFTFETADAMLDFARLAGMATRGHALIWHRQTPAWVFEDEQGNPVAATELRRTMQTHIFTVMRHFKGKVDAWDVVNEAIMDDGSLRTHNEEANDQKSRWYEILGPEYIGLAFHLARKADPTAKLYYNDYYNHLPARQQAIFEMLKGLLEKGVPIDGVGLQAHLNVTPSPDPEHQSHYQTIENLERAIQLYASLGLDVQITELDLSVYIGGHPYKLEEFYIPYTFDAKIQQNQAARYGALFDMFRRNAQHISSVTFWGIADDNTWLSEFTSGRQDFPLLFDLYHRPKPAFFAVTDF